MHPGEVGIYKTFVKHTANIIREFAENKKCHIRPVYNASGFQEDSTLKGICPKTQKTRKFLLKRVMTRIRPWVIAQDMLLFLMHCVWSDLWPK